jgi:hypothetical protein
MKSLEELVKLYINDWQSRKSKIILSKELVANIYNDVYGFSFNLTKELIDMSELELDSYKENSFDSYLSFNIPTVTSIFLPIFLYVAATYKYKNCDEIIYHLKNIEELKNYNIGSNDSDIVIYKNDFVKIIKKFNKNKFNNSLKLWLELQ